jgi:hypothetical protein
MMTNSARRWRWLTLTLCLLSSLVFASVVIAQTGPEPEACEDCVFGSEGASPRGFQTVLRGPGAVIENVLVGPSDERDIAAAIVQGVGGQILRTSPLPTLGLYSLIAAFPSDSARARAIDALAVQTPGTGLSLHWAYTFAQAAPRIYAPGLIGDAAPGRCRLAQPVRIGMIDGPVNTSHPVLTGATVRYQSLVSGRRVPRADHGTGVAALMVGEDATGILSGFARGAQLHAVSVFWLTDSGEETSVELIVQAIDRLVGQGVQVINMSFAGPDSAALRRALQAAAARGVVMVGAAGNQRARQIAHPAAAPEVIAVTAIDAGRRRFRLANVGAETEFSAPGVDVYAARERGGGYVSGTSFAAPIVTALIARDLARGTQGAGALRTRLQARVEPLGTGGRNAEFGWGLVRAVGC